MTGSLVMVVYTVPWSLSALPRVQVVSGLVRQDKFVTSRRFRENGPKDLKLSPGGGGARVNTLGAPGETNEAY